MLCRHDGEQYIAVYKGRTDLSKHHPRAMSIQLANQILLLPPTGIYLAGLMSEVTTRLMKPLCTSISLLAKERQSETYKLGFSDNTSIAAWVYTGWEETFDASAKRYAIEEMGFLRNLGDPIPDIYAFDLTFRNPILAPFVLMEILDGEDDAVYPSHLSRVQSKQDEQDNALSGSEKTLFIPAPPKMDGKLVRTAEGQMMVNQNFPVSNHGKARGSYSPKKPHRSSQDMCYDLIEREIIKGSGEWATITNDVLPIGSLMPNPITPHQFSVLATMLTSLVPSLVPSPPHSSPERSHQDIPTRSLLLGPDIGQRNDSCDTSTKFPVFLEVLLGGVQAWFNRRNWIKKIYQEVKSVTSRRVGSFSHCIRVSILGEQFGHVR